LADDVPEREGDGTLWWIGIGVELHHASMAGCASHGRTDGQHGGAGCYGDIPCLMRLPGV